ncbi:hypothetical protein D9M68_1006170 [compost metagenome]
MARASKDKTAATETADGITADTAAAGALPVPVQVLPAPRMGEQIAVVAAEGRVLPNLEFGGRYSETEVSPATVNLRILRLLQDGDLIRQPL